jgi:uracil-DNA glycosylase family 4
MDNDHICDNIDSFPIDKFLQIGTGLGKDILILGEAPAPNGWRISGKAFYTVSNKLLPTGKNLNKLLTPLNVNVENCSFTELIKCYVGKDRKLLTECGIKSWPIFIKQVKSHNFKLILILGVKTLEIFNKLAHSDLQIGKLAEVELEEIKYKVLPIYHPSPIAPYNHKKNEEIFNRSFLEIQQTLA